MSFLHAIISLSILLSIVRASISTVSQDELIVTQNQMRGRIRKVESTQPHEQSTSIDGFPNQDGKDLHSDLHRNTEKYDVQIPFFTIDCTLHELHFLPASLVDGNKQNAEPIVDDIPETYVCIDIHTHTVYDLISADGTMSTEDIVDIYLDGKEPIFGVTSLSISSSSIIVRYSSYPSNAAFNNQNTFDDDDEYYGDYYYEEGKSAYQMRPAIDLSYGGDSLSIYLNDNRKPEVGSSSEVVRTGVHSVAVVRVVTLDGKPSKSAKELSDDIFGTENDKMNLRSGYLSCSNNQLEFIPGTGNGLVDGVYELNLHKRTANILVNTVEDWVKAELSTISITEEDYDFLIFVLPDDVDFGDGGVAYAYLPGFLSVYKNDYATKYFALMHEMGHNLGHHHSSWNGNVYGDSSCFMGKRFFYDEGPAQCFNAPKSWYFSWYSDRHLEIKPSQRASSLMLVGVNDYVNGSTTDDHVVILKLDAEGVHHDLFIMYNRAEGINSGVSFPNQVMVVSQSGPQSMSKLKKSLDQDNEPYEFADWTGTPGEDLVIEVCSMESGSPDTANIIIYVKGLNWISCTETTPPTISPGPSISPKIIANYYEANSSWTQLPPAGLKSLSPYMSEMVHSINFFNRLGEFAGSGRKNNVAALFEGYLTFDFNGVYTICLLSDEGSKLYLDNQLIIDNDGLHSATRQCADVVRGVGISDVIVEYFETNKQATLVLEWIIPGSSSRLAIPSEAWAMDNPQPSISPAPSELLICEEDEADVFAFNVKLENDVPVSAAPKTCGWLKTKPQKIESACSSVKEFEDLKSASVVCKITCGVCEPQTPEPIVEPTKEPTIDPTMTPVDQKPSSCEEDEADVFAFNVKLENNVPISATQKTCGWLKSSKPTKIDKICSSMKQFGDLKPASDVCIITCKICSPPTLSPTLSPTSVPTSVPTRQQSIGPTKLSCEEDGNDKFLFKVKVKDGISSPVIKRCSWLQSKPSKISTICTSTEDFGDVKRASAVCKKTCKSCSSPTTTPTMASTLPTSGPTKAPVETLVPTNRPTTTPTDLNPEILPTSEPTHSPTEEGSCKEDKNDEFLFKLKEKGDTYKAISKTCSWLESRPSDVPSVCTSTDEYEGLKPAAIVCKITCGTCVSPTEPSPSSSPTLSPITNTPTAVPTSKSTSCEEDANDEFVSNFRIEDGVVVSITTKTCKWLQSKGDGKIESVCTKLITLEGYKGASEVCLVTCKVCG